MKGNQLTFSISMMLTTILLGCNSPRNVQPPQAVSVMPTSGSGNSQTFNLVYSDPNGIADLTNAEVVFNTAVNGADACWISVDPTHSSVSLRNDSNNAWMGPIKLGTTASLQNGQCMVNAATSRSTSSGNTVTVNLALTFQPTFKGTKNIYLQAQSGAGPASGWQPLGTWTIQ